MLNQSNQINRFTRGKVFCGSGVLRGEALARVLEQARQSLITGARALPARCVAVDVIGTRDLREDILGYAEKCDADWCASLPALQRAGGGGGRAHAPTCDVRASTCVHRPPRARACARSQHRRRLARSRSAQGHAARQLVVVSGAQLRAARRHHARRDSAARNVSNDDDGGGGDGDDDARRRSLSEAARARARGATWSTVRRTGRCGAGGARVNATRIRLSELNNDKRKKPRRKRRAEREQTTTRLNN